MAHAQPTPPYPPDTSPAAARAAAQSLSPPAAFPNTPPPPPPKAGGASSAGPLVAGAPSDSGPPLPPTPVGSHAPGPEADVAALQPPPAPRLIPPPTLDEGWLPDLLRETSKPDLEHLLATPALQTALLGAPATAHPSLPSHVAALESALAANAALAQAVRALEADVRALRAARTAETLQVGALEGQWRRAQAAQDEALAPWSPKAIHARLVAGVREQEEWCAALEESFLEGEGGGGGGEDGMGRAGEREVEAWVRRYREGRTVLALRRERRARFEEGRVGGWR